MTPQECVKLVAFLAARCPSMRLEDATPDAWFPDLAPYPLTDATEAVRRITASKDYASLAEIVKTIKALRHERLASTPIPLPAADPDDVADWLAGLREGIAATADGADHAEPVLPRRPVQALIAGAFRGVR